MNPDTDSLPQQQWFSASSMAELEEIATRRIAELAAEAIAERGVFRVVLAGGGTPRNIYRALRKLRTDWLRWQVYFGDERCLPAAHPERNSHMACETLLSHVPIPAYQIHPIPAELGAEAAAEAYRLSLAEVELFDLVLLGLGEDGHTASLFPGQAALRQGVSAVVAVHHAPKPPSERVSLSPRRLGETRKLIFLVGEGKSSIVAAWKRGSDIPASWIAPRTIIEIYWVDK